MFRFRYRQSGTFVCPSIRFKRVVHSASKYGDDDAMSLCHVLITHLEQKLRLLSNDTEMFGYNAEVLLSVQKVGMGG